MSFERGTFCCFEYLLFPLFGQTLPPSTPAFFAPLRSAKKSSVQVGLQTQLWSQPVFKQRNFLNFQSQQQDRSLNR